MATVFDVAKFILIVKGTMSTMKLQKLCYYCQAWHYAWTEHPLFNEKFQAWVNGPVCPDLFRVHKGKYLISKDEIIGNPDNLTSDEIDSIRVVLKDYGDMTPSELREQTHSEAPWREARGEKQDGESCDNEITLESMGIYYGSL